MAPQNPFTDQLKTMCQLAVRMAKAHESEAILALLDAPTDWNALIKATSDLQTLVAADRAEQLEGAADAGLLTIVLDMMGSTVYERLTQAILESVADDVLTPGASVVALYSAFESGTIDSLSVIRLGEHLGRLTVRDLRQLETSIPLDTLKLVVDLAVDIGREGREGKPVGTLFVVGDHRKTMTHCHPVGFDPVKGYNRKDRNLNDPRVREGIKEIAQMDGAIIVTAQAVVEAAAQYLSAPAAQITLSKGLGARHWAAAAISKATKAVAVAVSETNGTVRLFHNGEVVLRIEPFRRAMKWKDFDESELGGAPPAGE